MSALAANETRRQLRYNFTDRERIEKAKGLAESLNRYGATEAELARVKKDYASRLDSIQAEVDLLNNAVLSGYELREYLCFWSYDEPRPGRKTLRKREGMEVVAEEDMTEADRQMVIDIIDGQAVGTKDEAMALALAAPREWPDSLADMMEAAGDIGPEEEWMHDLVRDLFSDIDETILPRNIVAESIASMLRETPEDEIRRLAAFIRDRALHAHAGWFFLAGEIAAYLDAEKAKAAAKKAARTKARKANQSGTVDVPSDEGSRDDSGADSKNDL
jgi:hypothetical protein